MSNLTKQPQAAWSILMLKNKNKSYSHLTIGGWETQMKTQLNCACDYLVGMNESSYFGISKDLTKQDCTDLFSGVLFWSTTIKKKSKI